MRHLAEPGHRSGKDKGVDCHEKVCPFSHHSQNQCLEARSGAVQSGGTAVQCGAAIGFALAEGSTTAGDSLDGQQPAVQTYTASSTRTASPVPP